MHNNVGKDTKNINFFFCHLKKRKEFFLKWDNIFRNRGWYKFMKWISFSVQVLGNSCVEFVDDSVAVVLASCDSDSAELFAGNYKPNLLFSAMVCSSYD